eukprot:3695614-Amphidinium_carterae.1
MVLGYVFDASKFLSRLSRLDVAPEYHITMLSLQWARRGEEKCPLILDRNSFGSWQIFYTVYLYHFILAQASSNELTNLERLCLARNLSSPPNILEVST